MPRQTLVPPGRPVHHVLNRLAARLPLFRKQADCETFMRIMVEAQALRLSRMLAWCRMVWQWR